jgi:hypothetical protein
VCQVYYSVPDASRIRRRRHFSGMAAADKNQLRITIQNDITIVLINWLFFQKNICRAKIG